MGKINYSKAENMIYQSVYQKAVDEMLEEATLANLIAGIRPVLKEAVKDTLSEEEKQKLLDEKQKTDRIIEHLLSSFQNKLKKLKAHDPAFYQKLAINAEEETIFFSSVDTLKMEDWSKLKIIRDLIIAHDSVTKSTLENEPTNSKDIKHIESQQKEHVHKRYNVKKGWVPL